MQQGTDPGNAERASRLFREQLTEYKDGRCDVTHYSLRAKPWLVSWSALSWVFGSFGNLGRFHIWMWAVNIWAICILSNGFKKFEPFCSNFLTSYSTSEFSSPCKADSESLFVFLQPFLAVPTGQMIECMYLAPFEIGSSSWYTVSGFNEVSARV